jgi:hypothetical protein
MDPVDYKGLGLHDYLEKCPRPMDINQIKSSLQQNEILLSSILSDFSMVVENARKYSPHPHAINKAVCFIYLINPGRKSLQGMAC